LFTSHLVLFDIDGTLLSAKEEAWKIPNAETGDEVLMGEVDLMRDVIKDVTGIEVDRYRHRPSGKTDAQVVFELFEGICVKDEEIYDWMPKLIDEYVKRLAKVLHGPTTTELKPGVHELLAQLKAREDVLLSLLTGNCESAARLKLSTQGLEHYFNFKMGGFGDRAKHRNELPAIAVEKAKHHHGHHFLGKSVVVIGDTPSDVRCVEALGARVVAVATGSYSVETLKNEGPDFLFADLSKTQAVIQAILNPV